jgi:hypothetical protein
MLISSNERLLHEAVTFVRSGEKKTMSRALFRPLQMAFKLSCAKKLSVVTRIG